MVASGDSEFKCGFGRGAYRLIQGVQFALNALARVGEWSLVELGLISPHTLPPSGWGLFRCMMGMLKIPAMLRTPGYIETVD